jgi:hypothetical protein
MTPEALASVEIDRLLTAAGWHVCDFRVANIRAASKFRTMKSDSQARDRTLVAQGGAIDEMFLIRPELAHGAKIVWPDDE